MFRNKKGELTDTLIFLITVFILGVGFLILLYVVPQINDGLRTAGINNSQETNDALDTLDNTYTNMINNGFLMLFVGLVISMMITSFLVRTHPIFLFLYIVFLAISILLSFYLGNAYEQIASNPIFADAVAEATFPNFVLRNIAEILLATGALSMIIVFAKFSSSGNSGGGGF